MNRLVLAFKSFWKSLTDPAFAARVEPLFLERAAGPDLRVLAVLQRDGRLVDFLMEDIDGYSDNQVGAAVRAIHRDCRKALREYLTFEPVLNAPEEAEVTVPRDFDPATIRLTGNVAGAPPFRGVLKHHGWQVKAVQFPKLLAARSEITVLAPAEVEVS